MSPARPEIDRIPLLVALLALAACTDTPEAVARGGPSIRDSAGIVIVENGSVEGAPRWSVSPTGLAIGGPTADGPEQLFRVGGARTLPDGRVAVLNGGTGEIRIFTADGAFVASLGREGEGPGEFVEPSGLWPLGGDSLLAWDRRLRRLTVFDPAGVAVRVQRIEGETSLPAVLTLFEDGLLLVSDDRFVMPEQGYVPIPYTLARYGPDGAVADSLPGGTRTEMGIWDLGGGNVRLTRRLFDRSAQVAADPSGYWVGPADGYEIVRHDPDGDAVRVVRWEGPDRSVTEADVEADLRAVLDRSSEADHERLRRQHGSREVADRFAAYEQVLSTTAGGAWVRPYPRPGGDPEPAWLVFEPDGRLAATVRLPDRFQPLEIGPDHVLGVQTDDLDVEVLRRLEVRRVPPDPSSDGTNE